MNFSDCDNFNTIPYGIPKLDAITGGMTPSEFIMLGSRPGLGQLTLSMNIALNLAKNGLKTLFFSSKHNEETIWRLHTKLFKVLKPEIRSKCFDASFTKNTHEMKKHVLSLNQHFETRVDLVILDYLLYENFIESEYMGEQELKVSETIQGLTTLAKEAKIPVILLFGFPYKASHKPCFCDLKDTFLSEEYFDTILFLSRDRYRCCENAEEPQESQLSLLDLNIAKHKNLTITLNFNELSGN